MASDIIERWKASA